jgi:Zn-dependent protease with chaperone function
MREQMRKGAQPSAWGKAFVERLSTAQKVLLLVATPVLAVVVGALCVAVSLAITFAFVMFVIALPWLVAGYALLDLLLGDRLAELERKAEGIGKYAFFAPVGLATGPVILILGLFVPFVHVLMRLALSRNREFQADATAVELTRYPDALAGALRKLATASREGKALKARLAPLTIVPVGLSLFSTHPPLQDRIARIEAMAGASEPPLVLV